MLSLKGPREKVSYSLFILNGKKPWSMGYDVYKREQIKRILVQREFNVNELPKGYGFRLDERVIEYPWFFLRLPEREGKLLDAGSVLNFDFILSQPSLGSKKIFISTLAPESGCFWHKGVSYVYEDLRDTCYRENYFDWIVSLSTIEHVGMDNTIFYTSDLSKKENTPDAHISVIQEYHRILKAGGVLFLSVPFGQYKDHGWFQVFDSAMVDRAIGAFSPSSVFESHFRYEPDGWVVSSREGSKDATCFDIHQQKCYEKDLVAFSRAVVCLELEK
jgi:SAM-dependent methyltransferase